MYDRSLTSRYLQSTGRSDQDGEWAYDGGEGEREITFSIPAFMLGAQTELVMTQRIKYGNQHKK